MSTAAVIGQDGSIIIPPELQERYGLTPGTTVEFDASAPVLTVVQPHKQGFNMERARSVLGCAAKEMEGKTVEEWLDWIRGPVELPPDNVGSR